MLSSNLKKTCITRINWTREEHGYKMGYWSLLHKLVSPQTIKMHFSRTVETQRHWRRSGVFIINFKHTSHLFLVFLLIILNKCFGNKSFWHQLARHSSGLTSITSFQSLLKGEGVEIVHIYTYTYTYIYIYI